MNCAAGGKNLPIILRLYLVALKIETPEAKDLLRLAMPLAEHPYQAQQQVCHRYKKLPYLDQ